MFWRSLLPAAVAELQHIPVNHNLYFVFFVGVRAFDTVRLFIPMYKMCESRFGDLQMKNKATNKPGLNLLAPEFHI
jgi:hypothetical protein